MRKVGHFHLLSLGLGRSNDARRLCSEKEAVIITDAFMASCAGCTSCWCLLNLSYICFCRYFFSATVSSGTSLAANSTSSSRKQSSKKSPKVPVVSAAILPAGPQSHSQMFSSLKDYAHPDPNYAPHAAAHLLAVV